MVYVVIRQLRPLYLFQQYITYVHYSIHCDLFFSDIVISINRSITKAYYRNSVAGLLVFDMTHRQTFDNMEEWYEEARRSLLCPPKFVLVGHKADMADERMVSFREARQFAVSYTHLTLPTILLV